MNIPEEIIEAREKFRIIQVIAPTLGKKLIPDIILRYDQECPLVDGHRKCGECECFMGMFIPEETINSYQTYEGYCDQNSL